MTGASRGIGRAIAVGFAREGADVVVNYRQDERAAEAVVGEILGLGRRALAVRADSADRAAVEAMVQAARHTLGPVDILVNNAGILFRRPLLEIHEEEWEQVFRVNCRGCFVPTQVVARDMVQRRTGTIINVTSSAATRPPMNLAHYAASKGAVTVFTKAAALELAPFGVRVNAIAPGLTETDINRQDLADRQFREWRLQGIPLGKIGRPEELVGAAVFLASDEAALVTGSIVAVDGGATI